MRGWFARGLAFERAMVKVLQADARLPRAQRQFLGDFEQPRIETSVGVKKAGPGLRLRTCSSSRRAKRAGGPRRVETFSFKSRDFVGMGPKALKVQLLEDAREALRNYGETLDIRRESLQPLLHEGSWCQCREFGLSTKAVSSCLRIEAN